MLREVALPLPLPPLAWVADNQKEPEHPGKQAAASRPKHTKAVTLKLLIDGVMFAFRKEISYSDPV